MEEDIKNVKPQKNILKEFQKFIKQENLIQQDEKLLIGVSGGIDSTVLLYLIRKISVEYNLTTLAVHINYHLRAKESDKNEKFVRNLCYKLGIPLVTHQARIKDKSNLESKARVIRISVFKNLLKKYSFHKVVLGHNKNDQAETLLLNLFRRCGIGGMKGMTAKSKNIIRPLLIFTRKELMEFAEQNNIEFSEDSSNQNLIFDRNKIRHQIIPDIEKTLNPEAVEKISKTARIFKQTDTFLKRYCEEVFPELVVKKGEDNFTLSLNKIVNRDVELFYIFRKIFGLLTGTEQDFFAIHFQEIMDLIASSRNKYIRLPKNVFVIKSNEKLAFSKSPPIYKVSDYQRVIKKTSRRILFEDFYLSISQMKSVPVRGYRFSEKNTCYIDLDKVEFPLTIRHRQPGDKFTPLGMKQPKKLKNLLIDEKISKFERHKIILVKDKTGKIIWVAGIRINDDVKLTPKTQNVLRMKIMKKLILYRKAKRIEKENLTELL